MMAAAFWTVPHGNTNLKSNAIHATIPAKDVKEVGLPTVPPVERVREPAAGLLSLPQTCSLTAG
jgi:hypothetical protein